MGRGWTGHGMRRGWLVRGRERGGEFDWTGARVVVRATEGNSIARSRGVEFRVQWVPGKLKVAGDRISGNAGRGGDGWWR